MAAIIENGKVVDPEARAAAQALLRCFKEGGIEDEKTWLRWSLRQTPETRKAVYVIVIRHFWKEKKLMAKIANHGQL
jgi:hypothetical protein